LKLTPILASSLVRALVFQGTPPEHLLITGSVAIGVTAGTDPGDIDFVCFRPSIEAQLSTWMESRYFVGSGYKKEIDGVTFNAIVVDTLPEFQAWKIATLSLFSPGRVWSCKEDRIAEFSAIVKAATMVLGK
jgi:hypothetical protein